MGYGLGYVLHKVMGGVSDQGVTMSLHVMPLTLHVKGFIRLCFVIVRVFLCRGTSMRHLEFCSCIFIVIKYKWGVFL